jgi:DNA-binding MarR family transcriptional regulator
MELVVELVRRATALAAGLTEASGLSPTDASGLQALDALAAGPLAVGALREHLGLSSAAATGLVDRLERAGLAERTPDPGDRRRVLVALSPRAREFGARHLRPWATAVERAVARAGPEDLASVRTFLADVLKGYAPDPAEPPRPDGRPGGAPPARSTPATPLP